MVTIYSRFGNKVRELRKKRKISQQELAEKSHMDFTSISEIESGLRNPYLKTIYKIAHALGIKLSELLDF